MQNRYRPSRRGGAWNGGGCNTDPRSIDLCVRQFENTEGIIPVSIDLISLSHLPTAILTTGMAFRFSRQFLKLLTFGPGFDRPVF